MNNVVNDTLHEALPTIYFGDGLRSAGTFYNATNVSITDFTMLNTLGHGVIAIIMMGEVLMSIGNTTFENDPQCKDYDYSNNAADFSCSGSEIYFFYYNYNYLESIYQYYTNNSSVNFFIITKTFYPLHNLLLLLKQAKMLFILLLFRYWGCKHCNYLSAGFL